MNIMIKNKFIFYFFVTIIFFIRDNFIKNSRVYILLLYIVKRLKYIYKYYIT